MDPARVDEDRDAVTSFYESHPLIVDGTRRTVSVAAWLYDMELIFFICHIEARLQETMSHYCRRFQEAMLPHIPQELHSPELQALVILRNGLPPQIRQYVPIPMHEMTVGNLINDILGAEIVAHAMQADDFMGDHQAPVDDAGMGEPIHEAGPVFPEDPVPAVPLPEVPPQEAEVDMGADDFDPADFIVVPEDQPEDSPIIDISSDEEEEEELEEEFEEDMEQEPV
ncbi:hypothetical protein TIFTF001_033318 [Ficus carica]|uniref:Uncharacterized protein n=1 Tax=Ficus carica TaxID=3494 RepID=A0AA88J3J8_FICCA|nr:hypothetical protein TIFTF001_033318 [Ficus carica]